MEIAVQRKVMMSNSKRKGKRAHLTCTNKELAVLKTYFEWYVKNKVTPTRRAVQKAKKKMRNGSLLLNRRDDLIIKKLLGMYIKLRLLDGLIFFVI